MDMRELTTLTERILMDAGFAKAGQQTGFVLIDTGRTGQLEVHARVGTRTGGAPTDTLNKLVERYQQALVYDGRVEVYNGTTVGDLTKHVVVEEREPEPVLTAAQFELHKRRRVPGLRVVVGDKTVGTILPANPEGQGWRFEGDPAGGTYADRETAARGLLLVQQLREVLRYHVDEESVFENAVLTSLAALQSSPVREGGTGRVKIFNH
jgi:hypothetical protein